MPIRFTKKQKRLKNLNQKIKHITNQTIRKGEKIMNMDLLLQAIIVVFMLFLCGLCLFAVVVIVRDIIHENAMRKKGVADTVAQQQAQPVIIQMPPVQAPQPVIVQAPIPAPAPAPAPVEERKPEPEEEKVEPVREEPKVEAPPAPIEEALPTEEELAMALEESEDEDPNSVAFSRNTLTMEERYATLSTEFKRFFDDIVNHALSKDGVKENRKTGAYDYKIGSNRVVKITIRRGEIVCEFNFIDKDFDEYASTSGVKIKKAATVVRVGEASAVGVAKDGIDLVCTQIEELKQRKRELANEKRRQRRKAAKEAEESTSDGE